MIDNQELKDLVRKIKFKSNLNQTEIAAQIGVSRQYLSDAINGRYPFNDDLRQRLYEHFTYLAQSTPVESETDNSDKVPLIPILAQGGALTNYVGSVRASDCEMVTSPVKGADYAITIYGDSMSPDYPSGSHVLIKRINERAFIEWGKVYVLDTCNGVVIKRLMPTADVSIYRCESINDKYPPFEVATDNIYGVYRVLMVMVLK
jgi:phage repressor protein C with HTH and peptisase S24 domain